MQFFDNVLFIKIARYIVFSSGLFGLGIVLCVGSDILIILLISFFLSLTYRRYYAKRIRKETVPAPGSLPAQTTNVVVRFIHRCW
jgi:uncharacterized membrane protein